MEEVVQDYDVSDFLGGLGGQTCRCQIDGADGDS